LIPPHSPLLFDFAFVSYCSCLRIEKGEFLPYDISSPLGDFPGGGRGCRSCAHLPHLRCSTIISSRALLPPQRCRYAAWALFLSFAAIRFPSLLPFTSLFLHTTSFSPIRISGHILCSFSQVSGPHRGRPSYLDTDMPTALESRPVPHIAKV
jgi:hypothetical protein